MANGKNDSSRPIVLVIGTTGQIGLLIVKEFDRDPAGIQLRLAARKPEQVERLRAVTPCCWTSMTPRPSGSLARGWIGLSC
jgi:hypothetical protein